MTCYNIDDGGTIVSTDKAREKWEEDTMWDGNNFISCATGSQWEHETLYQSSKGNYWIESTSQYQGRLPSARWVSPEEAASWLLMNKEALPEDLAHLENEVME